MKSIFPRRSFWIVSFILFCASLPARAASLGVHDEAHFFSSGAISQAEQVIRQINDRHHRDLLVETVPEVPQDLQAQEQSQGRDQFFKQWADKRASEQGVTGVYVLICKNPAHLQAAVGNATSERLFTPADRDGLGRQMLSAFKEKQYDQGLLNGVHFVAQQMDAHVASRASSVAQPSSSSGSAAPGAPYGSPPVQTNPPRGDTGWGFGSIACVIVAVILGIVLIRGVMGRSRGSYGQPGGGYPPGGGAYPPGAYPPAGGYGGGYPAAGGSGFGRGFLGGLLGGALGGYATEKWSERNQPQGGGYVPPASGGGGADYNPGPDTSFSSSGGDFGSSDAGGGGGGGDFGGGGGGGGDAGGGGGGGDF
jgi:hypothetical protein